MTHLTRRDLLIGLGAGSAAAIATGSAMVLPRVLAQESGGGLLLRIEPCEINSKPIRAFERGNPGRADFGRLRFLGGLELTSAFNPFGGLSGLLVEPDGSGLLAVSDVGAWLSARIAYDGQAPAALSEARMGPLLDAAGKPLDSKVLQDAEGLTLSDGSLAQGTVLVSFEREHRIVPYQVAGRQIGGVAGTPLTLPADARALADNASFEAVAVLRGGAHKGATLAFAERYTPDAGYHTGWMWIDGTPQRLYLRDIEGFDITDAAGLDNGDLLVLERRYRRREGVQMRLRQIGGAEVAPGARISGDILLQAKGDAFDIDNMEGLAVHRDGAGHTILTLLSDDNFNRKDQRTLLLQFRLLPSAS
ncbi:MAG: esterase-like activity of phytase family protein [Hyphomicrobiaceae bacterium]|nr:esterase-like activity of phytase family protein [Hyphomicrobiaceae bacterium]